MRTTLTMEDYQRGGRGVPSLREFYQFLLKEEATRPEAPANAEFGQYAFATTRKDVPAPREKNTAEEEIVRKALDTYMADNRKGPLDAKVDMLLKLRQQGYYSNILDPSHYAVAYRILELQPETLAWVLQMDEHRLGSSGVTGPGVLSPHTGTVSGWTVDPIRLIAKLPPFGKGEAFAVFAARIAQNRFFGNPGKLATAIDADAFAVEMETIAVGPVSYEKCAYVVLPSDATQPVKVNLMRQAVNKVMS